MPILKNNCNSCRLFIQHCHASQKLMLITMQWIQLLTQLRTALPESQGQGQKLHK